MSGRCLIYCRISRDRVGAGLGVERQEQDCRDLAARLDLEVVGVHIDNDLSAYSGKVRPAYRAMLAAVDASHADTIICWHVDRLTRSMRDLEDIAELCDARGVSVRTVTAGDIDLTTASGKMVARMLGAAARHEIDHARERMKRARQQVREAGGWGGGRRPYGYEPDGVTVRDTEAAIVREIAQRLLVGDSLNSVTAALNARGALTSTGHPWSSRSLRAVMLRPRNAGHVSYRGREVGTAAWPALLEDETWRAVRSILTDPARGAGRPGRPAIHLGSGLYLCGRCDSPVFTTSAANQRGDKWLTYRCRDVRAHIARKIDPVDAMVIEAIHRRLARGDVPWTEADPAETQRLRVAQETQARLLVEVDDAYADQAVTVEQWRRTSARIQQRLDDLTRALDEQARPSPAGQLQPDVIVATWHDLPLATRKAVIDSLVVVRILPAPRGRRPGGGYFDRNTIQITWR